MAEILSSGATGDGYDARYLLANGEAVTLHFRSEIDFQSADIAAIEAAYIESVTPEELEILPE